MLWQYDDGHRGYNVNWRLSVALSLLTLMVGCVLTTPKVDTDLDIVRESKPGDVYAQMGIEYMKDGQPAVALHKLKRGLELDPNNAEIHAVLGTLYRRIGELGLAETHYLRSIALEPQNPFFRNDFGDFLCQRGEYDQAEAEFAKALQNPLYNQPWEAHANAGMCAMVAGRHDVAERHLSQALTTNPRLPSALFKMAQLRIKQGKYSEAQDYIVRHDKVVTRQYPPTLLLKLKVAVGLGHKAKAIQLKNELLSLFPNAPENKTAKELTLQ